MFFTSNEWHENFQVQSKQHTSYWWSCKCRWGSIQFFPQPLKRKIAAKDNTAKLVFNIFFFFCEWEHRTGTMCPFSSLHPLGKGKEKEKNDMDDTRLFWKECLNKTIISKEVKAPGRIKGAKDRTALALFGVVEVIWSWCLTVYCFETPRYSRVASSCVVL